MTKTDLNCLTVSITLYYMIIVFFIPLGTDQASWAAIAKFVFVVRTLFRGVSDKKPPFVSHYFACHDKQRWYCHTI